jgi:hypothetical protein
MLSGTILLLQFLQVDIGAITKHKLYVPPSI